MKNLTKFFVNPILNDLSDFFNQFNATGSLVIGVAGCDANRCEIEAALKQSKLTNFLISTSCTGFMGNEGVFNSSAIGLFVIEDERSDFGVATTPLEGNIKVQAAECLKNAIYRAGHPGEMPLAIWLVSAPGCEETILEGFHSVVGKSVPIIGGSLADNEIKGDWWQITPSGIYEDSMTVVVMYGPYDVYTSFLNGYDPTQKKGKITSVKNRTIVEIDHRPAGLVLNEWMDGRLTGFLEGGVILGETGLNPLGRIVGEIHGINYYQLSHPEKINSDQSVSLFTNMKIGDEVILMEGSLDQLVERAPNLIKSTLNRHEVHQDEVIGIMMSYCAGCRLTLGKRIEDVYSRIDDSFDHLVPWLCMFSFGEQGQLFEGRNAHGNLMISVLIFSNREQ